MFKCFVILLVLSELWSDLIAHNYKPVLEEVTFIFRHSDRYPTDVELTFTNCSRDGDPRLIGGDGLLKKGLKRAYKLGVFLKDRYGKFLDESCPKNSITAYSTDFNRTRSTLKQVLRAFGKKIKVVEEYKARNRKSCDSIPFTTMNHSNYFIFPTLSPIFQAEYSKVFESAEVSAQIAEYNQLFKILTEKTCRNVTSLENLYSIHCLFESQKSMRIPLPSWTEEYQSNITRGSKLFFDSYSYNRTLKRLNGGIMIKKILNNLKSLKSRNSNRFKLILYSAHDSNIESILRSLNLELDIHTYFTSGTLIGNLHKNCEFFSDAGMRHQI